MIGAEHLRDIRRQGLKPRIVFVIDVENCDSNDLRHPDVQLEQGNMAEVHIERKNSIAALDFRFLTGCVVAINSDNKTRARQLYKYIRMVKPQSITVSDSTFVHHEVVK